MLGLLIGVFRNKKNCLVALIAFCVVFIFLFVFSEVQLIASVLQDNFPLPLFFRILPDLVSAFLFDSGPTALTSYILTAFLFCVYFTLLFEIFVNKKYFSILSLPSSILSLVGVSLGITCLSCGFVGGLVLLSLFGIGSSTVLLSFDGSSYLFFSLGLIMISIIIALYTIKKLTRKKALPK